LILNSTDTNQTKNKIMSEKQTKFGLFPGGDPRNFQPDASICTDAQVSNWRNACDAWNHADASGQILSDLPSEEVCEPTVTDYATASFGAGIFEIGKAASEPEPPAELDEATFNEIMDGPVQPLPFRAVLG
jgi:hypothetical protein